MEEEKGNIKKSQTRTTLFKNGMNGDSKSLNLNSNGHYLDTGEKRRD